jgi:hypothetical protein
MRISFETRSTSLEPSEKPSYVSELFMNDICASEHFELDSSMPTFSSSKQMLVDFHTRPVSTVSISGFAMMKFDELELFSLTIGPFSPRFWSSMPLMSLYWLTSSESEIELNLE